MDLIGILVGVLLAAASASLQKGPKQRPPAIDSMDVPQFEEGTPQAVTFGDCWTEDWMVLGVGNYRTEAIRTKSGK